MKSRINLGLFYSILVSYLSLRLVGAVYNHGVSWWMWKQALVFGFSLAAASFINGHDELMMMRSKVDFIVNLLVSSLIGACVAVIGLYLMSYEVVGRWIVVCIVVSYIMVSFGACYLNLKAGRAVVYIRGVGAKKFDNVICELGKIHLRSIYDVVDFEHWSESKIATFVNNRTNKKVYIVGFGLEMLSFGDILKPVNSSLLSNIHSIENVIELELEVVCLEKINNRHWSECLTRLRDPSFSAFKRCFDVIFCLSVLPVAVVVILAAGGVIKLIDGGEVFYRQIRLGQFGRPFSILKLRTMLESSEVAGAQWAKPNDPRVTGIGRVLRKTRIDELPQIWNILSGDMSLVGPRPERPEFYGKLVKDLPEFGLRLAAKPGLTGWAQVNCPYGASVLDSKIKLLYDLYYIKNSSVLLECRIVTRTIVAMVRGAR